MVDQNPKRSLIVAIRINWST